MENTIYAIKAFRLVEGEMRSLFAVGVLEQRYVLNQWNCANAKLADLGLGLFAFESYANLRSAYRTGKSDLLARADVVVCVCECMEQMPIPAALISMDELPVAGFGIDEVLASLDAELVGLLEPGALTFRKIRPVFILY